MWATFYMPQRERVPFSALSTLTRSTFLAELNYDCRLLTQQKRGEKNAWFMQWREREVLLLTSTRSS
jgi:hypothetical protein